MPARLGPHLISKTSVIAISMLVPAICLLGCSGDSADGNGRGNRRLTPAVEAVQASFGSLPLTERLNGVVRAENQVELYPEISARVTEVYAQNGDLVAAGDPLVRLRDTELRERLRQAEADYQIAVARAKQAEAELQRVRNEFGRSTSLAEKDLISPGEFEEKQTEAVAAEADAELARARVDQARATIDERKEALSRTVIRAPVQGSLGNRHAEVGQLVTPNTRLFTLGQLDEIRVEVVLTDRMLSYIREGQRTEILSPSIPYGMVEAPLARISPFLHPQSHSTTAEIDLANPDNALMPGMFVTVDIFYGESEQATLVPLSALWENPATASTGVFVTRDSLKGEAVTRLDGASGGGLSDPVAFEFVPVEVIAQGRMSAGVRGVQPGSWVVTIGQDLLGSDSARARVRPVDWDRVERLQQLQRENLLDQIIRKRQTKPSDTTLSTTPSDNGGDRS